MCPAELAEALYFEQLFLLLIHTVQQPNHVRRMTQRPQHYRPLQSGFIMWKSMFDAISHFFITPLSIIFFQISRPYKEISAITKVMAEMEYQERNRSLSCLCLL